MATTRWLGKFDGRGNPVLSIRVSAAADLRNGIGVKAIIDTGFSGFVLLPAQFAISLGLRIQGTTTIILADDSPCNCLLAEGYVGLDKNTVRRGVITLEPKCKEALIGMDFLRQFGLALLVTSAAVLLHNEKILNEMIEKAKKRGET
jgi:predicted aspartyl protease